MGAAGSRSEPAARRLDRDRVEDPVDPVTGERMVEELAHPLRRVDPLRTPLLRLEPLATPGITDVPQLGDQHRERRSPPDAPRPAGLHVCLVDRPRTSDVSCTELEQDQTQLLAGIREAE